MGSVDDILQLCRLCLVKDQVNIPIFDETSDIRQTFLKINSCLPVKVSRDDSLPKKICDGCSYKLDMLYVFRNTSVDSEKQLLSWLDQIGLSTNLMLQDQDAESEKPEVTVKQEALESSDRIEEGEDDNGDMGDDSHSYLMQQQKLPYQDFEFGEPSSSNTDLMGSDEPAPKRAKRAAAMKKHVSEETEEDELDAAMQITKAEDEDSDEIDNPDFGEEEIPSTSADDQDQPGPSGVGKGSIEAPSQRRSRPLRGMLVEIPLDSDDDIKPKPKRKYESDSDFEASIEVTDGEDSNSGTETIPSKNWTCMKCCLEFRTESRYNKHREVGNCEFLPARTYKRENSDSNLNQLTWSCNKCFRPFPSRHAVSQHQNSRLCVPQDFQPYKFDQELGVFVCDICSMESKDEKGIEDHIKIHVKFFLCDICQLEFKSPLDYGYHMREHDSKKLYKCPLCKVFTTNVSTFTLHINQVHYYKYYNYCQTCGKGFSNIKTYKEHENFHLNVRPFVCEVCDKTFVYSRALYEHQVKLHFVRIEGQILRNQCPTCKKRFSKRDTFEKHMASQHLKEKIREKKHLCDFCGKGFPSKDKLNIHRRVHTGVKPYSCKHCGKSFSKKYCLTLHERIHTGEKPYACEYCGKRFNQPASFKIHLRGHTGEKPYACQFCKKAFVSKASLDAHKRVCKGGD